MSADSRVTRVMIADEMHELAVPITQQECRILSVLIDKLGDFVTHWEMEVHCRPKIHGIDYSKLPGWDYRPYICKARKAISNTGYRIISFRNMGYKLCGPE